MPRRYLHGAVFGTVLGTFAVGTAFAMGGGGELVIVANQEPQSMQAQVTYKEINGVGLRNVIENLTRIDPETNEILPMLATSWEQVEPTRWHFKLREGVKFHDGSPVDGEAVAVSINWLWGDENNYSVREMMGPQISAEPVDATTVAVITAAPDPLLPRRIYLGGVTSGKQILENPAGHDVHPIGTGPYVFEEWKQGQYWTATANADWWGNTAEDTYGEIFFDRLRVVWRPEPIVRSAMVESGEAHIALFLTKEECARFEATEGIKCFVKGSDTFLQFRLDYHGAHPAARRRQLPQGDLHRDRLGGDPPEPDGARRIAPGPDAAERRDRLRRRHLPVPLRPGGGEGHRRRDEGERDRDPEHPHLHPARLDPAQRRDGRGDGGHAQLRRDPEYGRRRGAGDLQSACHHEAGPGASLCVAARAGESADGLRRHLRRALLVRRHRVRVLRSRTSTRGWRSRPRSWARSGTRPSRSSSGKGTSATSPPRWGSSSAATGCRKASSGSSASTTGWSR